MLRYDNNLKHTSRLLRKNMTDSERVLWSRLHLKQIAGMQFYRQKPIGKYIVDFYAPKVKLVIEVDGSQHMKGKHVKKDEYRDAYLTAVGLRVLRFNSREVLKETNEVIESIYRIIMTRLK